MHNTSKFCSVKFMDANFFNYSIDDRFCPFQMLSVLTVLKFCPFVELNPVLSGKFCMESLLNVIKLARTKCIMHNNACMLSLPVLCYCPFTHTFALCILLLVSASSQQPHFCNFCTFIYNSTCVHTIPQSYKCQQKIMSD